LGCRFDGWNELCRFDLWEQALRETGISGDFHMRRRLLNETLPWDHLSSGVTKAFLQRELARAFERTLTPDCSVERCTYCGACDFAAIRNVDYHVRGAKGGEHRGEAIDHWASDLVSGTGFVGAWEPRGWHKVHSNVDVDSPVASAPDALPVAPAPGHTVSPVESAPAGLGNAEEWLSAGAEALAPMASETPARPQTRIRLIHTKLGSARFIGNLELTTLFYRAARRARLPLAFSQGHHPLPRFAFGPALPLGLESTCEYVDVDLVESLGAATVRQRF